ncbi:MAG: Chemotaxis Response Regulator protein CheB-glutamate methylesterase [Pseudomonadota bacterium]|jgi:two-component system chemotaxis response regulator CheB
MTRVLIVDDSPTMRAILSMALRSDPGITVVGEAPDAMEARSLIKQLNPDVVTLDIEMPGMNGIDFLEKIMQLRPMPVIIVSSLSQAGAAASVRALELGAFDCVGKPVGSITTMLGEFTGRLVDAVHHAARSPMRRAMAAPKPPLVPLKMAGGESGKLIAIGASTGGIEALHRLLPLFPADCPPTLVVQHINQAFAKPMAEMLETRCAARVKLAETGEPLLPGTIYIAPGGDHHLILGGGSGLTAKLTAGDKVSGHRPSVDKLFGSIAANLGAQAVGVLLTGMGSDGAQGLAAMRAAGAFTVAQDEATSTVYGMPRAAAELGAARAILPIDQIAAAVLGRTVATVR